MISSKTVDSVNSGSIAEIPVWLQQRRQTAWDAFSSTPLPSTTKDEDWRRTDVSKLPWQALLDGSANKPLHAVPEVIYSYRQIIDPTSALVVSNSTSTLVENHAALIEQGIVVCSLAEAVEKYPELVKRGLAESGISENKFLTLWNAKWENGCFVYVPKGVSATMPIIAAYIIDPLDTNIFPASIVMLEEQAELTFIDLYVSPDSEQEFISSAFTSLVLDQAAQLKYCTLQQWRQTCWHFATHKASLGKDSNLQMFATTLGAKLQKTYWDALLNGPGAEVAISGICYGQNHQHLDHQSLQAHHAPHTSSNLLLKVAVKDQARSVYSGLIEVDKIAQQTDAYVQNRNLILNHGAKADTVPRLEIKANDVKCGHGATAGHVDEDQLFYLQSRGIDREQASKIILRGFLDDALTHSPHQGFTNLINAILDQQLA